MQPGLITGLTIEARALTRNVTFAGDTDPPMIFCAGGDGASARFGAEHMIDNGAAGLISIGLAGGLAPALKPGVVVLPRRILAGDNEPCEVDTAWRARCESLLGGGFQLSDGDLLTVDEPVSSRSVKAALHEETGAAAVDMESWYVADAAAQAALPFIALRVIGDPAVRSIPEPALKGMRRNGTLDHGAVARATLIRPWIWIAMIGLARETRSALNCLSRVGARALPLFGLVGD